MNNLINQLRTINFRDANAVIKRLSGIVDFFVSEKEKNEFVSSYELNANIVCEDKVAYGDWQTPISLAEKICETHILRYGNPDVVIEPTCGLGAFVISALKKFPDLSEVHAIEINQRYTNELKLRLLIDALNAPSREYPDIYIYNADCFEFVFSFIIDRCKQNGWNLAVIGNPPWVTNSSQGRLRANNLPAKRNIYGLKGIDAITGKSNFDISESITLYLLKLSQFCNGGISFLLKNSVIHNLLIKQRAENINIGEIEQRSIDASSEFNVSVSASCFSAKFNREPSLICTIRDFYSDQFIKEYGWVKESFVADTILYSSFSKYDKPSTYVWRSGVKHDCASVLELTLLNGEFVNGFGEIVKIEEDLIYPLLKSSDIIKYHDNPIRKFIIVPQKKIGEDTSLLKHTHPLTYSYLSKYETLFHKRKSSIYKGKDKFSIFGIGDYSFSRYKIVISSLYKNITFQLVSPYKGKPVLVDDTCYQLDFNNPEEAESIYDALTCNEIQSLLHSLVFTDSKRVVTKSLLMRLDLEQVCKDMGITINSRRFSGSSSHQLSLFD